MKKTSITLTLSAIGVFAVLGIVIHKLHAQAPFTGYTAFYADYYGCDPRTAINCPAAMQYQEDRFPDFQGRVSTTPPPGKGIPSANIETTTSQIMVVPSAGSYYKFPWKRPAINKPGPTCNRNDGSVRDSSVTDFMGHPAVKYDNLQRNLSVTYLTDAGCFGAVKVFKWTSGPATYQVMSRIAIGAPDINILLPPAGMTEKSPLEVYHDFSVSQSKALEKADPEKEWNATLASPQGDMIRRLNSAWQTHRAAK